MGIKKLTILGGFLILAFGLKGQNQLHLTQYNLHQPFINPAAISSYSDMSGAIFYKKQWTGFEGAPTFQGLDFNMPIGASNSSAGITLFNDKTGITRNTFIEGNYAYRLSLNKKNRLAFGLSANMVMTQKNYSELEVREENDPEFTKDTPNLISPNFRFGMYYFRNNFYLGFATPNLLHNSTEYEGSYKQTTEFDPSAIHYYFHGGYQMKLSEKFDLQPSVMVKEVPGSPMQFDINVQALYMKKYGLGLSYRTSSIMTVFANAQLHKYLKLAYGYDLNFSELQSYSGGNHEIMLIFELKSETKKAKINIPRF